MTTQKKEELKSLNLWQRKVLVGKEIAGIVKDGYNAYAKYKYVSFDQAKSVFKPALLKHGIDISVSCEPSDDPGHIMLIITLRNVDKPEELEVIRWLTEVENKAQKAIPAAQSNGTRQWFLTSFLMPCGEDFEQLGASVSHGEDDIKIKKKGGGLASILSGPKKQSQLDKINKARTGRKDATPLTIEKYNYLQAEMGLSVPDMSMLADKDLKQLVSEFRKRK